MALQIEPTVAERARRGVAHLRRTQRMSIRRFAATIGSTPRYVSAVEAGRQVPSLPWLEKAAAPFGLTVADLLAAVEDSASPAPAGEKVTSLDAGPSTACVEP